MLPGEQRHGAGVGSAVGDLTGRGTGCLQFVPARHGEVVRPRATASCRRGRVRIDQKTQHAEPVRRGRELPPVEALPRHERVHRDAESAAHPGQRLAFPGGNRRDRERAAAGPQIHGGGQGRAQPSEPGGQWLTGRQPLVLQFIDGDKPARTGRVGHHPMVAAPADGPVLHRCDGDAPRTAQRRDQRRLGQAIRRGQHLVTVTADRRTGHPIMRWKPRTTRTGWCRSW